MATKKTVNEGSTSYHALDIRSAAGAVVVPEVLRYRLTAGEGIDIVPWTPLSTAAVEVEISAESNIIGTIGKKRYLTVEATHGGGDKITSELEYSIVDLKGMP
jgi:hypothetical protein